ncbi:dihydrofolate reductase family protein [Microbacterium sp.]|uniref:dihydrofolate reductase family protein n=1 Tax=Microbacterium sp. TaxID=51671 RepID=UPI00333EC5E7
MRLVAHVFLTADGVMQGPGSPGEDTSGGFDRGGWMPPYADADSARIVDDWYRGAEAVLLGRGTFELFRGYWPNVTDPDDLIATSLNTLPKYVASTTLGDPAWTGTTVLGGDVLGGVLDLLRRPGGELQVHGSRRLTRSLHRAGLIDEYRFLVFPVTIGSGTRLFGPGDPAVGLRLQEATRTAAGAVHLRYTPDEHRAGAFGIDGGLRTSEI